MRDLDKADIPPDKTRHDMTIDRIGFNEDDKLVMRAIIDNGEYKGKRVSTILSKSHIPELEEAVGQIGRAHV